MKAEALVWTEYDRLGEREVELQRELMEVRADRAALWSAGHALGELGISAEIKGDSVHVSVKGRVVVE